MTVRHLFYRTGDREQDLRREERIAWVHYLRMAQSLADTPLGWQATTARKRVDAAKADFAQAWRALDEVLQ